MHELEAATDAQALRRGRQLEYVTLGWNLVEGVVSIAFGAAASSVALVGFGIDSFIESASGATLLWRLGAGRARAFQRERIALKLVGISFLLLAAWVAYGAGRSLLEREAPDASLPGVAVAILSLFVMPWLARRKRRVARRIDSRALHADSRQTDLCAWLSAILLVGLLLNALLGWWWADPAAALAMVPIIAREGIEALRAEAPRDCC